MRKSIVKPVKPQDVTLSAGEKLAACLIAGVCAAGHVLLTPEPARAEAEEVEPENPAYPYMPGETCAFTGTWNVEFVPDAATRAAGKGEFQDSVLFEDGLMMSGALGMYGFKPGKYFLNAAGTRFTSATTCERGTLTFTGTHHGRHVTGVLEWLRADGAVWRYDLLALPVAAAPDGEYES